MPPSSLIRAAAASFGEKPSSPSSTTPSLTLQALTQRPSLIRHHGYNLAGNSPLASALEMGVGGLGGGLNGIGGVVNGLRGRDDGHRGGEAAWANRVMNYGPNTGTPFLLPSRQYSPPSPLAVGGPAGLGSWQTNAGAWAQYGLGANARSDDDEDYDLSGQDDDLRGHVDDLDTDQSRVTPLKTAIGVIKLVDKGGSKKTGSAKSETKEYTFRRKSKAE